MFIINNDGNDHWSMLIQIINDLSTKVILTVMKANLFCSMISRSNYTYPFVHQSVCLSVGSISWLETFLNLLAYCHKPLPCYGLVCPLCYEGKTNSVKTRNDPHWTRVIAHNPWRISMMIINDNDYQNIDDLW